MMWMNRGVPLYRWPFFIHTYVQNSYELIFLTFWEEFFVGLIELLDAIMAGIWGSLWHCMRSTFGVAFNATLYLLAMCLWYPVGKWKKESKDLLPFVLYCFWQFCLVVISRSYFADKWTNQTVPFFF